MRQALSFRTDFCDELIQDIHEDETLSCHIEKYENCEITTLKVKDVNNILQKEVGEYITVEFESLNDYTNRENIIKHTKRVLISLMKTINKHIEKVLVVGLGNRNVISDALGPNCCDNILVTSHLYANHDAEELKGTCNCAVFIPGVMGQTGMESAALIQSVVSMHKPDLLIVVDALATSSLHRINRAIQINNVGITPGSGVGNYRKEISEKTLHIPVIALGVATVTSIGTLLHDAFSKLQLDEHTLVSLSNVIDTNLFVTPKSIDKDMDYLVSILSEAINISIHPKYENL